ncbi:MAG TPA: DUF1702 family protein [Longimicrobium sp.]|nr:DUF1702 family protein [Longimicrobium sp.]
MLAASSPIATRATRGLRLRLLGIDPREATFARRGFHAGDPAARERLEGVGHAFLRGYHAALAQAETPALAAALDGETAEWRGFAYEGAAMALALLDRLAPWGRGRLRRLLGGAGDAHAYMVHVGAGWALARLRARLDRPPPGLDPLLGWLALDGYGFHEGYFHPEATLRLHRVPRRLSGYARRAFDQGVGRSLWFACGADPARVAACALAFGPERAGDVWSGVGLACAYAGATDDAGRAALLRAAGADRAWLAQGAAFGAQARERAGNPAPHTEAACLAFCGTGAAQAARVTLRVLASARAAPGVPAYEAWRRGIREHFSRTDA